MPENQQQKPSASIVQITIESDENNPSYSPPKNQQYPLTNATIPPQYLSQVNIFWNINIVVYLTNHSFYRIYMKI